jgi:hypothetical protein
MQLAPTSNYLIPKYLSFATFLKGSVSYLYVMIYSAFGWLSFLCDYFYANLLTSIS